ncbi:hypothetical protein ASPZODRAFT_126086 [Penicilliopsis zonata CBS 506.65]|uniref:NAD(P)-binding domain-containing protein n=1 Tax=Penicilliopsis zonata CBS 506.65 TaxID=1073090 RepID=A0A1L9S4K2_9EURO|nr:hypothetical protein ASPZODRAFT_126086 [Penicilliopsis zonata CBS 506.65]OJJ42101.1 hypothetical protein ASPZODRAFT_126086 [Penicilliopsis zonata CBS 506.65]
MHLILTGATGLVGSSVLDAMLHNPQISKISILSRRKVDMADAAADPRVEVINHQDFNVYKSELLEKLADADGCVWALGISQAKVTKSEYVTITKDYALAAANAFLTLRQGRKPFRFIYVSGEGATQTPGWTSVLFARVKGETETALGELSAKHPDKLRADSVRPAAVDASAHTSIKPYIPYPGAMMHGLGLLLLPLIRWGWKSGHSPTQPLGIFLTDMAMGKYDQQIQGRGAFRLGGGWVVENVGMRRMLGL